MNNCKKFPFSCWVITLTFKLGNFFCLAFLAAAVFSKLEKVSFYLKSWYYSTSLDARTDFADPI